MLNRFKVDESLMTETARYGYLGLHRDSCFQSLSHCLGMFLGCFWDVFVFRVKWLRLRLSMNKYVQNWEISSRLEVFASILRRFCSPKSRSCDACSSIFNRSCQDRVQNQSQEGLRIFWLSDVILYMALLSLVQIFLFVGFQVSQSFSTVAMNLHFVPIFTHTYICAHT